MTRENTEWTSGDPVGFGAVHARFFEGAELSVMDGPDNGFLWTCRFVERNERGRIVYMDSMTGVAPTVEEAKKQAEECARHSTCCGSEPRAGGCS